MSSFANKKRVSFASFVQEKLYEEDASISPHLEVRGNFLSTLRKASEDFDILNNNISFKLQGNEEFPSLANLKEFILKLPSFQKAYSFIETKLDASYRTTLSKEFPDHLITLPIKEEFGTLKKIDSALAQSFKQWLQFTRNQQIKRQMLLQSIEYYAYKLKRSHRTELDNSAYRRNNLFKQEESNIVQFHNKRILSKYFLRWKMFLFATKQANKKADIFYAHNLLRKSFNIVWKHFKRKKESLNRKIRSYESNKNAALLRKYFHNWLQISRRLHLEDERKIALCNQNLVQRFLYQWAHSYEIKLKDRLYEKLVEACQTRRNARIMYSCFSLWWRKSALLVNTKMELSRLHYKKTILSKIMKNWLQLSKKDISKHSKHVRTFFAWRE